MKIKSFIVTFIGSVMLLILVLAVTLFIGLSVVKEDLLKLNGSNASDFAALVSKTYEISNDEYQELISDSFDFDDLKDNEANNRLAKIISSQEYIQPIKNVYILTPITDSSKMPVVYGEEADFLGYEDGTKLDSMWLLNVHLTDDGEIDYPDHRDNIYRYTKTTKKYKELYDSKSSAYDHVEDAWGKFITGFAPVYTSEGTFVGMLGIDFSMDLYEQTVYDLISNCIWIITIVGFTLVFTFVLFYISYIKMNKEKLYIDSLTSFYNRSYYERYFKNHLDKLMKKYQIVCLLIIDIDDFKKVNDTFGHEEGDRCLKEVSNAILSVWNFSKNTISRYGGEEFVMAFGTNNLEYINHQLNQILENVRSVTKGDSDESVTVSIGAVYTEQKNEAITPQSLLLIADDNLYIAKGNGKNQIILSEKA